MQIFITIYVIGLFLVPAIGMFVAGFKKQDHASTEATVCRCAMFGVVWPILLLFAIISAPFFGLFRAGKYLGTKYNK